MGKQESLIAKKVLGEIANKRGVMWDKISHFKQELNKIEGVLTHKAGEAQSEGLKKAAPLKHNFEGGLYTRAMFMPKGSIIVSMIHKQQHPTFLLTGKLSYITDAGEIETIEAPHTIFTQIGTQRVFYMHENSSLCCVYKVKAKTFLEAEAEVYTNNYRDLPPKIINKIKKKLLCQ